MIVQIKVEHQSLMIEQVSSIVEDTLGYIQCVFDFLTDDWDNTVKTAYFRGGDGKIYSKLLDMQGTCIVPWEVVQKPGFLEIAVAGEKENYRITSSKERIYNGETIYGGHPSQPPTPDQYEQIIGIFEETRRIAQSVRDDADAGKFTGPPGPEGPQGPRGDSGITFPASGFFGMYVDENGDLYVTTADQGAPPPFRYDEETGDLYWEVDNGTEVLDR